MKILAVVDGKPASVSALKTAVEFAERLRAELGVISVRPGTHAMEDPAPVGVDIPAGARSTLPPGIRNTHGCGRCAGGLRCARPV